MLIIGDCREKLKELASNSVQCVVTSPPYYNLRDYGVKDQIGQEATANEYVQNIVDVFKEVHRILKKDGTVWLNIGDSYAGSSKGRNANGMCTAGDPKSHARNDGLLRKTQGAKQKDLLGIPWRVAFALQEDGWYLRQDIIWAKPNAMPEPVKDRCTRSHEYIFLLSKSRRYYFDSEAIKEDAVTHEKRAHSVVRNRVLGYESKVNKQLGGRVGGMLTHKDTSKRNKRDVWFIHTKPYAGAHCAVFPPELITPCILAGSRIGDVVLDPFFGSGTVAEVCEKLSRQWIGIELNAEYKDLYKGRLVQNKV